MDKNKNRCFWANPRNALYIKHHDEEWGKPEHDDSSTFIINDKRILSEIAGERQSASDEYRHPDRLHWQEIMIRGRATLKQKESERKKSWLQ